MKFALQNQQVSTRRLTKLYIIALCTIAFCALAGQLLIQISLMHQSGDARTINIAGRQRMLSQRLCKASLALLIITDPEDRRARIEEIRNTLSLWERSHIGLQHGDEQLGLIEGNSEALKRYFSSIEPNFLAMRDATKDLIARVSQEQTTSAQTPNTTILPFIQILLAQEPSFLTGMDTIVTQYQSEAEERVTYLKIVEILLLSITLIILILEGFGVFRPAVSKLQKSLAALFSAQEQIAVYMTELERKNGDLELAFNEAVVAHRKVMPHARVVAYGHYQVQGHQGKYYAVTSTEKNGNTLLECECLMYQRSLVCSHSLAAAALHSALLRQPRQKRSHVSSPEYRVESSG
jgi:nitrate/nitrite-specific signal transduction histidine kinase